MQSPISADGSLDIQEVFDTNPNTSFTRRPWFWACYCFGVLAFAMLVHQIVPAQDTAATWTVTNIAHALVCNVV